MSEGFGRRQCAEKMAVVFLPCFVAFGARGLPRLRLFCGSNGFWREDQDIEISVECWWCYMNKGYFGKLRFGA